MMSLSFGKKDQNASKHGAQPQPKGKPAGPDRAQNGDQDKESLKAKFRVQKSQRHLSSNPRDWNFRAELIPKSIVRRNQDRVVRNIMVVVAAAVAVICILVSIIMVTLVHSANNETVKARQKYSALSQQKQQYKEVEDTLNAVADEQLVQIGVLYNEVDWQKLATNLNTSLPDGGSYEELILSEYQLVGSGASSAGSGNGTVWSSGGVISVQFTVTDPTFVSAEDFIKKFEVIPGYLDGQVDSITQSDPNYTYTGSITIHLVTTDSNGNAVMNTTQRSDNSAGSQDSNRQLLASLRQQLEEEAAGLTTASTSTASGSSSSN